MIVRFGLSRSLPFERERLVEGFIVYFAYARLGQRFPLASLTYTLTHSRHTTCCMVREFGGRRGRWWDAKMRREDRPSRQQGCPVSFAGKRQADIRGIL